MIKAIIFDWGGVVIEDPTAGLISIFTKYLNIEKSDFLPFYRKYEDIFQKGKISEKEYWLRICNSLKIIEPDITSLWKYALRKIYKENEQVFALIRILKNNGFNIGLLSNTEPPTMEFFIEKGYKYFNPTVFSCKEGLRKPNPAIYKIMLNKLQVLPREVIFIDDNVENLINANELGIFTILFENIDQLKDDLNFVVKNMKMV